MARNPFQNAKKQGQTSPKYKDRSNGLINKARQTRLPPPQPATSLATQPRPQAPGQNVANVGLNQRMGQLPPLTRDPGAVRPTQTQGRHAGSAPGTVRKVGEAHTRADYQAQQPQFTRDNMLLSAENIGGAQAPMARPDWMPGAVGPADIRERLGRQDPFQPGLGGGRGILDQQRREFQKAREGVVAQPRRENLLEEETDVPGFHKQGDQYYKDGFIWEKREDGTMVMVGRGSPVTPGTPAPQQGSPQQHGGVGAGGPQGLTASGQVGGGGAPVGQAPTEGGGGPPPDDAAQPQQSTAGATAQPGETGGVDGYGAAPGRQDTDDRYAEGATLTDDWTALARDLDSDPDFIKYLAEKGFEFYRETDGSIRWYHPSEQDWISHQDAGDFHDELTGGDEVGFAYQQWNTERGRRDANVRTAELEAETDTATAAAQQAIERAEQKDFSGLQQSYEGMKRALEAGYKEKANLAGEAQQARAARGNLPSGAAMAAHTASMTPYAVAGEQAKAQLDVRHQEQMIEAQIRNANRRVQFAMAQLMRAETKEDRALAYEQYLKAQQDAQSWEEYQYQRNKPGAGDMILGAIGGALPLVGKAVGYAAGGGGGEDDEG